MKNLTQRRHGIHLKSSVVAVTLAIGGLLSSSAHAGTLYFDFNQNNVGGSANASVFLFGTAGQTATISNIDGFNQTVTLGADGFFNQFISNTYQQSGTGVRTSGFQVVSPNPIAGYFINRAAATTDMTYLFDGASLGTNYVVASQGGGFGEGSQVAIHATAEQYGGYLHPLSRRPRQRHASSR